MLTNAIAPRQQRVNIRAILQRKQLQRFVARDLPAVQTRWPSSAIRAGISETFASTSAALMVDETMGEVAHGQA